MGPQHEQVRRWYQLVLGKGVSQPPAVTEEKSQEQVIRCLTRRGEVRPLNCKRVLRTGMTGQQLIYMSLPAIAPATARLSSTWLLSTTTKLANLRGQKWDEMFAEFMAESQKKTNLAERQRQYMRTQKEKEMQLSQDIITSTKDTTAVVRNSIAKVEGTYGRSPEPECSPSKHALVMPAVPYFHSQPYPSAPRQYWLQDQQQLLSALSPQQCYQWHFPF
ncbi:uncharacterized protein LOC127048038 [Gopherus flavomarginatus]|uniref:uncharacterized protein LOC127048038 n=1 Tax=Gopherus flavomarginatus TaxID=286002 RepID=UPI0021CBB842|nr:uncharacterized protein LOC127048038 [Gopherus flavomarginatus]